LLYNSLWQTTHAKVVFSTNLNNPVPAGEIVSGKKIVQPISIPGNFKTEDMCFEILFATYDRVNNGTIEISIRQNNKKQIISKDIKGIKDNSYQKLCFNEIELEAGQAYLEIYGVDGSSGNAITVWLTDDIPFGGVFIDGQEYERGLTFKLGYPVDPPAFTITGGAIIFWLFVLTYLLIITFIFLHFIRKPTEM